MKHSDAAAKLSELGHVTRLQIFRILVKAGPEGLAVSDIQKKLKSPGSTLSHHISRMVNVGLLKQVRDGRVLQCHAEYSALTNLMTYLSEECCVDSEQCKTNCE